VWKLVGAGTITPGGVGFAYPAPLAVEASAEKDSRITEMKSNDPKILDFLGLAIS